MSRSTPQSSAGRFEVACGCTSFGGQRREGGVMNRRLLSFWHPGLGTYCSAECLSWVKSRPPVQRQHVSFHQLRTFSEARSSSISRPERAQPAKRVVCRGRLDEQPPVSRNRGAWAAQQRNGRRDYRDRRGYCHPARAEFLPLSEAESRPGRVQFALSRILAILATYSAVSFSRRLICASDRGVWQPRKVSVDPAGGPTPLS